MKVPRILRRKKLRVSATRRSLVQPELEYEEMAEPNMKLSRALLIVLVLHVVAVAGIIAFNTIKSRQGAFPPPSSSLSAAKKAELGRDAAKAATESAETKLVSNESPNVPRAAGKTSESAKAENEPEKIPRALPVETDSGKTYVVAKGDNPVKIAKHLKVSESELLSVNHIDDPRKLQIGQKLIIPASKAGREKKKTR
ncbi:MAG: LysM peptidoglycan-binding domain-containing protein [Chthoniobacterales bacterium]